jgi:hypothetical protein
VTVVRTEDIVGGSVTVVRTKEIVGELVGISLGDSVGL